MISDRITVSLITTLVLATGILAQTPSPYQLLTQKGAYLQALEVQEAKRKAAPAGEERERAAQGLAGFYNFVGDYQSARQLKERAPSRSPLEYPKGTVQTANAIAEIVREARGRQIVILNEAHDASQNRAFATQLALALRKEGFSYFAAETFSPNIAATQKRGYPNRETGYYTFDPVFGDLVRQALRAGYKLVAYETEDEERLLDPVDAINARETAQTKNLRERVFRNDPKARIFIYVGFSHAQETDQKEPDGRTLSWMAARLKRETGLDPLTIEQSEIFEPTEEKALAKFSSPVERFKITEPSVLRFTPGKYWLTPSANGSMDMQVFHPFPREKQGRPDWLAMKGYRKPFPVKDAWLPKSGRTLIQAFAQKEGNDAIPVDQLLLTAGKPAPVLMLPKGNYRLVIQDGAGRSRPVGAITQK